VNEEDYCDTYNGKEVSNVESERVGVWLVGFNGAGRVVARVGVHSQERHVNESVSPVGTAGQLLGRVL